LSIPVFNSELAPKKKNSLSNNKQPGGGGGEEVGEEEIPMHTKKNCLKAEELLNLEEQRDTREGGVEEGRR